MAKASQKKTDQEQVSDFMAELQHPLKTEIDAVREIIKNADARLSERIKWNAPSYYYKIDMAAFHLRQLAFVHIIMVYPQDTNIVDTTGLLEGNHKDRREIKLYGMEDIAAKKPKLEAVIAYWFSLVETVSH